MIWKLESFVGCVCLTWDCALTLALWVTSSFTTSICPAREAMWRAVFPFCFEKQEIHTINFLLNNFQLQIINPVKHLHRDMSTFSISNCILITPGYHYLRINVCSKIIATSSELALGSWSLFYFCYLIVNLFTSPNYGSCSSKSLEND